MRSVLFLFAMNFVFAHGQSADSIVIRERHEFIQYVKEDRARAPLLSVIIIINQNDTSYGIVPGVSVPLLISDLVDSVSVDSMVNRLLMWDDCIPIDDSTKAKYDVFEYRDSLSLTDQFREMTIQQLLDSYFDEGYFYHPFISKNIESALIITFYERNIPMRFDDYWGNLRIDRVKPVLGW